MKKEPLAKRRCVPCEGGVRPLAQKEAQEFLKKLSDWNLVDEGRLLAKHFIFKDFAQTFAFANKIADIAEKENHHPDLTISYGSLMVELSTHAIGGLSENDFILAAKIDVLAK